MLGALIAVVLPQQALAQDTSVLKICKEAGIGVKVGTLFTFNVNGRIVTVPAGPAPGGYCAVAGEFRPGLNVKILETLPDGYTVSAISVELPEAIVGAPNLPGKQVTVNLGSGITEVTFTNERRTGWLEICKEGEVSGDFSFTVSPSLGSAGPFTVPAGACTPAIEVPAGTITITEAAVSGVTMLSCRTIPANRQGVCNPNALTSKVEIVPGDISQQTVAFIENRGKVEPPEGLDLEILKELIGECNEGSVCSFKITIINHGPDTFSGPIFIGDDWNLDVVKFLMVDNPWVCDISLLPTVTCGIPGSPVITLVPNDPPNDSVSFIIGMTVPADLDADSFENCASIMWPLTGNMSGDNNPTNDESCIVVDPCDCEEDGHNVAIEKIAEGSGPNGEWVPGDEGEFILQVTNIGDSVDTPGETIIITDNDIPSWFDITLLADSFWNCTVNMGLTYSISCEYIGPPVPTGDDFPPLVIEAVAQDYGEFRNCAGVELIGATDIDLSNNEFCVPVVVEGQPTPDPRYDIMLEKTFETIQGPAGPMIMFILEVTNLEDPIVAPVTVNVSDILPPGFTFVPPVDGGPYWNCSGLSCVYNGPPIGTGQSFPQIEVIATAPKKPGVYENCAAAELLNATDINNSNNTDCVRIEVVDDTPDPRYDIAVAKTPRGPGPDGGWIVGMPGQFILSVGNMADPIPQGFSIILSDVLPPEFIINSDPSNSDWECTWPATPANNLVCSYIGPPVPAGPVGVGFITLDVTPGEPGKFENCARVELDGGMDVDTSNNENCVSISVQDDPKEPSDHNLAIEKTSEGTNWPAASQGTYVLNITNLGDPVQPPAEVHVTDDLPNGFVITSVTGTNWNCLFGMGASNGFDCEYVGPPIPKGQPYPPIVVVITTPKASGDYRNCATVGIEDVASAGVVDGDLSNNESCTVVTVRLDKIPGGGAVGGVTVVGVFTELTGTTVVNTGLVGEVETVTVTGVDGTQIDDFDVREEDGSVTINVSTGTQVGTITIEGQDGTVVLEADGVRPTGPPGMTWPKDGAVNVQSGTLNETFAVPATITRGDRPAGDYDVRFGSSPVDVVAIRGGEIAVTGKGIPMQNSGEAAISIAVRDGPRVSGQIPAWSYLVSAQLVTQLNTWAPIFFQCSGLPAREPILIRLSPKPWQKIEPREISLTCGEANARIQIGQYQTSREGPQSFKATIDRTPGR